MKTFIVLVALSLLATFHFVHPFHASATVSIEKRSEVPAVDLGITVQAPVSLPTVPSKSLQKPVTKPVAKVAMVKAPATKRWVCGAVYDNWTGGRNSDCKWQ